MPGKIPSQMQSHRSEQFMVHAMDTWGNSVYLVALSQTQSAVDAQDVSQDVFLRLLTSDVPFNDEEHEKAWIRTRHAPVPSRGWSRIRHAWAGRS